MIYTVDIEIPPEIYAPLAKTVPTGTYIGLAVTKVLREALGGRKRHSSKLEKVEMYLYAELINGPVPVTHLVKELESQKVSRKTIARAKKNLGITSIKEGWGGTGGWFWQLPE